MAKTLDRREAKPMSTNHQELERHYRKTCDQWPGRKVELINCALAGVPLYLVIDATRNLARLLSHPEERGYQQQRQVILGEPLELPAPRNLAIDTGKLIEG